LGIPLPLPSQGAQQAPLRLRGVEGVSHRDARAG